MTTTTGQPQLPRLRTAQEVAQWLRKSAAAVYEDCRRGAFPPDSVVRLGRRLYFDEAVLIRWVNGAKGS